MSEVQENLSRIRAELQILPYPPKLIAVSKKKPLNAVKDALLAGQKIFGENQIKEAIEKFSSLYESGTEFELHHLGKVQSGTLKKLFGFFHFTHGVCSESSLKELSRQSEKSKKSLSFFLEANLLDEQSKQGLNRMELLNILNKIRSYETDYLKFAGLMTMGPADENPTETKRAFSELRKIRDEFCPNSALSMGMSGDYKIAIEEKTDYIRIGTSIFGNRIQSDSGYETP